MADRNHGPLVGIPPLDLEAVSRRLSTLGPEEQKVRLARAEAVLVGRDAFARADDHFAEDNVVAARYWYRIAATCGMPGAREMLAEVEALITDQLNVEICEGVGGARPVPGAEQIWASATEPYAGHNAVRTVLRRLGRPREFHRQQTLLSEGAESDEVLLIEQGLVKVLLSGGNGTELIAGFYGPGELIGELGVMEGLPHSATVIAHTPGCAVHVPRATFLSLMRTNQDVLLLVNSTLQRRLRNADRRGLSVAFQDVPTRVAKQLLSWADTRGEQTEHGVAIRGMSQKELAQSVGASAKTVDAALKRFRAAGLVMTSRMRYLLPDQNRLAARVKWTL